MLKRLRWMVFGALAGVGGSVWVQHRVKRVVGRFLPESVTTQMRGLLSRVGADLRASIGEGRKAMAERENELRARLPEGVTPLPRALGRRRQGMRGVIDAVSPEGSPEGAPDATSRGHIDTSGHPAGSLSPTPVESTVTELTDARRSRPRNLDGRGRRR